MKNTIMVAWSLALLVSGAHAQSKGTGGSKPRSSSQVRADARETAGRLQAVERNGTAEQGRLAQSRANENAMSDKASRATAAGVPALSAAEQAAVRSGDASMSTALKNLSAEGRDLLAQNSPVGTAGGAPKAEVVRQDSPAPDGPAPKPTQLRPVSLENPGPPGSQIVITCTGAAFFDSAKSIALFTDNVEVRHPQFFVSCDEFEVHLIKDQKPKEDATKPGEAKGTPVAKGKPGDPAPNPDTATKGGTAGAQSGDSAPDTNIKFAIARGRMVTIEKRTETGEIQVGHAKHATYEGATGNILLRDFPQVQRGQHLQIATDPATTMLLKQNGALETKGPSRTEIVQEDKTKKPSKLNSQAPAPVASPNVPAPSPASGTSPRSTRQ